MENFSKYLCIFGGGAIRGYAYLGILRAFEEVGFYPEKIAGSSVGAIFAAFSALDMPLKKMEKIFMDVNFELFKDINFSFAPAFSISKGNVFLEWLRKNIEECFYKENYKKGQNEPVKFKDLKRDLIILTTDLGNCKTVIFSKEETPDFEVALAIRISTAMPGLMTPVEYQGKLLADGDILKGRPMWCLNQSLNPTDCRILDLRLEGVKKDEKMKSMLDYANTVYSCMTNAPTDEIIKQYSTCDRFDIIKIDTKDLILVDFNVKDEVKKDLALLGYMSAMKFFKVELPQKREELLQTYIHLRELVLDVERNITDVKKVKMDFGDLFFALITSERQTDKRIYKLIKKFKILYEKNIVKKLFGVEKLENKTLLKSEILNIKEALDKKCIELTK